jgi:glutaredoxin
MRNEGNEVTVYGAQWCRFCLAVKEFLDRRKVDYIYKDVEDDCNRREVIELTKGLESGIPVIKIGRRVIIGFDEDKIVEVLSGGGQDAK